MQRRLVAQLLPGLAATSVASLVVLGISVTEPSYASRQDKFSCKQEGNVPVTKVRTPRGPQTLIRWVANDFFKVSPLQRCRIVSARFQRYYDNGALFITSRDNLNGYPVLCISNRRGAPCTADNVLVTLKPGTDTSRVLQQMLSLRRDVGESVINLSGCQAFTYDDGDVYVDVKEFLDGKECSSPTP
ncbi:COP23 domain-containing protein [Nostoc sp. FACHB-190]|uniref:COP23 domain-containing protein n=1 Tax=Nostoc sp. FACHB-190 TaxID=2692838 RepID=UPI001686C487|nr:COP23 domain-containing protein [Nostoc sp. FACHB-190]MBD2298641.1 hypothetical protein [Nostoc sp. FACHB-190]